MKNLAIGVSVGIALSIGSFDSLAVEDTYGIIGIQHTKLDYTSSTRSTDNKEIGFDAGIGYTVNENLAVELTYNDYKDYLKYGVNTSSAPANQYTSNLSATSFSLGGIFLYPAAERIKFLAKAGIFSWKVKSEYTRSSSNTNGVLPANTSSSDTDKYYGVGLQYRIDEAASVRADYTKYIVDGVTLDGDRSGVSLIYKF